MWCRRRRPRGNPAGDGRPRRYTAGEGQLDPPRCTHSTPPATPESEGRARLRPVTRRPGSNIRRAESTRTWRQGRSDGPADALKGRTSGPLLPDLCRLGLGLGPHANGCMATCKRTGPSGPAWGSKASDECRPGPAPYSASRQSAGENCVNVVG